MKNINSGTTTTRRRPFIVGAMGLMAVAASIFAVNTYASGIITSDMTYVENAFPSGSVLLLNPYGTFSATSVSMGSPCSDATCQNTSGNSITTSSSSNSLVGGIGSAKAGADLSTGVVGAYAQELGITGASAAAGAGFWDTLTFSGVSGTPTGTMVFTVPGAFTDVGYGAACEGYLIGLTKVSTCGGSSTGSNPFGSGVTALNASNNSETLTLNFPLADSSIKFAWVLGAAANNSFNIATADAYDPPHVSLELPAGVTYGSASGVFLNNPAPVPLPAAAWLFGSGLVGLIGIARRKKTSA